MKADSSGTPSSVPADEGAGRRADTHGSIQDASARGSSAPPAQLNRGETTGATGQALLCDRRMMIKEAIITSLGVFTLGERMWGTVYDNRHQATPPAPVAMVVPELPAQTEGITDASELTLRLPVAGVSISSLPTSRLPNAMRLYRRGFHHGLDLYCAYGTAVCAIADGIVTRADDHFTELSRELHRHLLATCVALNTTPPDILRHLTGRTVEVDHGTHQGMRVRSLYGHLSDLFVNEGALISKGGLVGAVGNSGTTAGVGGSREDSHIHLEVWTHRAGSREVYLGQGMGEQDLRQLLREVFSDG